MKKRMSPMKEKRDLAKRKIAVVGVKADGSVTEWGSVTLAQLAIGCGSGKLHEIADSGKPYKGYVRIYFKD